jgi:hypothetical protein
LIVSALLAITTVPNASAQITCQGSGTTYQGTTIVSRWGLGSSICYANKLTATSSVSSFTYYLSVFSASTPPTASAYIINVASSETMASVYISSLLPTTGSAAVTATFSNPPTLDPNAAYWLAFCITGTTGNLRYSFSASDQPISIGFCNPAALRVPPAQPFAVDVV